MGKIKNNHGFTLIEVLVSIVILSIGLVALSLMQVRAVKGNATGSAITQLSWVAMDRIEFLQNLSYDELVALDQGTAGELGLDDGSVAKLSKTADGKSNDADYPGFTVVWNVADDTPGADSVAVRVFVIRDRDSKQVQYDFFVADV